MPNFRKHTGYQLKKQKTKDIKVSRGVTASINLGGGKAIVGLDLSGHKKKPKGPNPYQKALDKKNHVGKPHQDLKFDTKLHDYGRRAHTMTAKQRKEYRQGQGIALSFTPMGNTAKVIGGAAKLAMNATKTTRAIKAAKNAGFTGKWAKRAIKPYSDGPRYVAGAGGETYLVKSPLEMRKALNFSAAKNALQPTLKNVKPKMLKNKRKNHA